MGKDEMIICGNLGKVNRKIGLNLVSSAFIMKDKHLKFDLLLS